MALPVNPFLLTKKGLKAELLKYLKKEGKDAVNAKNGDYGQTLLHVASYEGRSDIVELLVDKYKADVNAIDRNGWTPLHSAAAAGNFEICEILLNRGSFARALTNEGASPLHYLVRSACKDPVLHHRVFKLILEKGANINQQNKFGETPLHQAAQRGRTQWLLYLINNNADVNVPNNFGETCLHFSIRGGHKEAVTVLLGFGANPNIKSSAGTCLDLARRLVDVGVTRIIENAINGPSESDSTPKPGDKPTAADEETFGRAERSQSLITNGAYGQASGRRLTDTAGIRAVATHSLNSIQSASDLPTYSGDQQKRLFPQQPSLDPSSTPKRASSSLSSALSTSLSIMFPTLSLSSVTSSSSTAQKGWICKFCKGVHMEVPLSYHTRAPHQWDVLTDEERSSRAKLSTDLCSIDDKQFFLRGLLELPIKPETMMLQTPTSGRDSVNSSDNNDIYKDIRLWPRFRWGVWVQVSVEDFNRILQDWCKEGRESMDQVAGELATNIGVYSSPTIGLKVKLKIQERGTRPLVTVVDTSATVITGFSSSGSNLNSSSPSVASALSPSISFTSVASMSLPGTTSTTTPIIVIEPHALVSEQLNGINTHRLAEFAEKLLHTNNSS